MDKRHSEGRLSFVFDSENQAFLAPDPVSPHPDSTSNIPTTTHRSLGKPKPGKALRRSIVHTEKRDSSFIDDEDAKLVMESLLSSKGTPPARLPPEREDSDAESDTSLFEDAGAFDRSGWTAPVSSPGIGDSQADASIAAHARLVARYEGGTSVPASSPNKVMTPSQFEHYRQQQELRRTNSDASKSDDCVDSEFDEEDEAENNREAEKQRRKQEAHMSVYRQQMMKVTGQQASAPSLRPPMEVTNNSTPNLGTHSPKQGSKSGSGKSSEGDEDDEVPLAILAAHGFPNRNRPPNHLGSSKSIPNLRASFQPHMSSGIVPADHDPSSRGSLPVFARNLPRDPYFGASLVNNSNRESLALGGGSHPGGPPPNLPPGGLVGVIASEERARAIRRGSPNAHGSYEPQLGMPGTKPHFNPYPSMPTNVQGVSGPQYGPSPSENTQIQLSQQMTQMMHTQMQWMQQMMQMQGMQGAPQLQIPRGFPPSSLANADVRPVSMPSGPALGMGPAGPRTDQRTLSMLDPNIPSRWNSLQMPYNPADGNRPGTPSGQGYPPSIAPSERSNIGMAPRYRPVSTIQQEQRSNTLQSASRPWGDENRKSISIASQSQFNLEKMTPPPTVTIRPVSSSGKGLGPLDKGFDDEADDDEGWAEMMKKRQQKKDGWKAKRATTALGDLMNAVH